MDYRDDIIDRSPLFNLEPKHKGGEVARTRFDFNLKRDFNEPVSWYALQSIFCSTSVMLSSLLSQNHWIIEFLLVMGGINVGMAISSLLCRKYHTAAAISKIHDVAFQNTLMHIDADRISKGLKPLSELLADD